MYVYNAGALLSVEKKEGLYQQRHCILRVLSNETILLVIISIFQNCFCLCICLFKVYFQMLGCSGHQSLTSGMELKKNILVSGNADSTVKVGRHRWSIMLCSHSILSFLCTFNL